MEYGLSKEFLAMIAKRFPQFAQQAQQHPTWQEQVLAKGWGYAEYIPTSVQDGQRRRPHQGHHRPGEQRPAAQTG